MTEERPAEKPPKPKPSEPGFLRVLSPAEWKRLHNGQDYERVARERGWLDDDDDSWRID